MSARASIGVDDVGVISASPLVAPPERHATVDVPSPESTVSPSTTALPQPDVAAVPFTCTDGDAPVQPPAAITLPVAPGHSKEMRSQPPTAVSVTGPPAELAGPTSDVAARRAVEQAPDVSSTIGIAQVTCLTTSLREATGPVPAVAASSQPEPATALVVSGRTHDERAPVGAARDAHAMVAPLVPARTSVGSRGPPPDATGSEHVYCVDAPSPGTSRAPLGAVARVPTAAFVLRASAGNTPTAPPGPLPIPAVAAPRAAIVLPAAAVSGPSTAGTLFGDGCLALTRTATGRADTVRGFAPTGSAVVAGTGPIAAAAPDGQGAARAAATNVPSDEAAPAIGSASPAEAATPNVPVLSSTVPGTVPVALRPASPAPAVLGHVFAGTAPQDFAVVRPGADFSVPCDDAYTLAATANENTSAGLSPATAVPPTVLSDARSGAVVNRRPGAADALPAVRAQHQPVSDEGEADLSFLDESQLQDGDEPDDILPTSDVTVAERSATRREAHGGGRARAAQEESLGFSGSIDADSVDGDVEEASGTTARDRRAAAQNPRDGVYTLSEMTRKQITTLLRALFVVQKTSDKSIMPFLGIVHYLMGFSALVGVSSATARTDFFDALLVAFERPVSMKFFMEEAFQCGPQGLHVGGRTRPLRHVAGQPQGLKEDLLRERVNGDNARVQWIARRLSLRQRVDVHPGAKIVPGGLSTSDRETIAVSVAREGVSSKLRERGCIIKYAKAGASDRRPTSIVFQWDTTSTWFPGSLEAGLVEALQYVLLKATPVAYKDSEQGKEKVANASARVGMNKRQASHAGMTAAGVGGKRVKTAGQGTLKQLPVDGCATCGRMTDQVALRPPSGTPSLEHWSADVSRSAEHPYGGHVLAIALPMHMDAGPQGRPRVDGILTKTSKAGGPPYTYSLSVVRGEQVSDAGDRVQGARFVTMDGRDASTGTMSFDILRSVRAHMSRRSAPVPTSDRASRATGSGDGSPTISLSVRTAVHPASLLQTHRFDFASDFELQTKGELVERTPGRAVIFWPGMVPLPAGGSFSL